MSDKMNIVVSLKDKASKGLKDISEGIDKIDKSSKKSNKNLTKFATGLSSLGSIVAGGVFLKSAISTFASFDDNMRAAGAVTGATTEEMERMTQVAKTMGQETRYTASQSAEALKFLGMAGFDASQSMEALPGVLNLAAAGSLDLGTAADIATNVLSAYGMEVSELGRVNDVMAKTFTSSNTNLVEIGEAFKMVGPIAKGVGADFEDLVATIGALGNAGIKGTLAGTSLKNTLDALLAPTSKEKELFDEFAQRIGQTSLQVKDAEGNFIGFSAVLEQLEKAGIKGDEALQAFGMRAGPGLAALINQGSDSLKKLTKGLKESEGTAKTLAEQMEKGLGGELRRTLSVLESFSIALIDAVDEELIEFLVNLQGKVKELIDVIKELEQDGTFKYWGDGANWVLDRVSNSVADAWNRVQALTSAGSSILLAITGDMDAARLAYADYAEHVAKIRGTYVEAGDEIVTVTKKITKEMLATRSSTKKVSEDLTEMREVVVGFREDGSAITVLEEVVKKVATETRVSADEFKAWKKEAQAAYKDATDYAKEYADKVTELENKIKENKTSTADTIRSISRQGLSDEQQWADRKKEAEEKLSAAKQALYQKDYDSAEQLAKQAQTLYASLAEEVTKTNDGGEDVVVKSLEQTKKIAIAGIEEVGSFNDQMYTKQKENAAKSQKTWEEAANKINEKLEKLTADREANIAIELNNLNSVKSEIAALTRNETKTITIRTVTSGSSSSDTQEKKEGGMIYGFSTGTYIPRNGKLPGYGGGDKVKALLEPGEGILRKEAMAYIGEDQLNAWNALRFNLGGAVPASEAISSNPGLSTIGGGPSETLTLRFQAGEKEASVNVSDVDSRTSLKLFAEELERMKLSHVE